MKTVASSIVSRKSSAKFNQQPINHIVFAIDKSGSMYPHESKVPEVFDAQIANLAKVSKELDQETRVTIYLFDHEIECVVYDTDVLRLPSLKGKYHANGGTSLIDATSKVIDDLKLTPEIYGEHGYLVFVLSDGEDQHSKGKGSALAAKIKSLSENWTFAALVPDQRAIEQAAKYGFPKDNIMVWDVASSKGIDTVSSKMQQATRSYMQGRATGVRGTKTLFQINNNISTSEVKSNLEELSPSEYTVIQVRKDSPIKEYVESWTKKPYVVGSGYYQLTKKETIQASKHILIRNTRNGKVYSGDAARQLLGLPDYDVKVEPTQLKDHEIFVNSTSVNRKLIQNTKFIVLI